ncbi:hypothetical protein HBI22_186200 [Parastagonospora nodorum]|nr:hypothetical protein HBI28_170610 [Parastagonospora nodorum]KAH5622106.1 hypothetical protein HBI22_186200 [Parastagonospora nodorum]
MGTYKSKANTTSSNSMSQTNVREGYRITTLEVIKLIEDLTSYLAVAKCTQLQNAQIPKVFHEAAYSAKVKTEDLSNTLTPTLSKTAQRQSSSVVSNRSTALITDKFGVALLTEPAILNDANVALVDAVHYSVVIDALTITLIKDDDDLLGTVNSHIKSRRLRALLPPEQPSPPKKRADSRHAKASRGRTKKDKDLEDSNTSSDVLRPRRRDRAAACAQLAERKQLGKEAQLKKTRDEEELAKAKKEKEEKEAQERETQLDSPLDSDDYRSDSSSDIDPKDDSEDEEATTAKDLAREQKERLKALLNAKTRDGLSARVGTAIEHCTLEEWTSAAVFFGLTDAYILYFKELSSNNGGIFANAIGIGKTRAIVLATEVQNAQAEGDATEYNAVNDDDKLCPTKGERTFYCACERSLSFNAEPRQAATMMTKNIGRPTKEEAIEMRINTTNAISKALAAANKLVALRSYTIPEANTPAVHPKATKHRLAPSAAQFVIVCSFGKVDKHMFRAYNTMSVTAQRTIIRKGGLYIEKRAILLPSHITQQCRDILEKEGLNKLEASRRVIFNRFEMQAIASYPALATLKAAQFKTYSSRKVKRFTLNSVKDLFTNLSKDYFLVREARAITKSSPKFQNLSNLCSKSIAAEDAAKAANILPPPKEVRAKILIRSYKLIVQAVTWLGLREKFSNESVLRDPDRPWIIVALMAFAEAITLTEATHVVIMEPQDRQNTQDQFIIVYFNLDSELELKVLGKQDVKTTSRDKLQGGGSTVTDQRID